MFEQKSELLMRKKPHVFDEDLAVLIGVNEALIIQQIEFWCNIKKEQDMRNEQTEEKGYIDGHYWTYNTVEEWNMRFPYWSYDTVKRALKRLRDKNLVKTGHFNKKGYDRTLWYTVNHEELIKLDRESRLKKIELLEKKTTNSAKCTIEENSHSLEKKDFSISAKCTNEENSYSLDEKPCKPAKTLISAKCPSHLGNLPQAIPTNTTYYFSSSSKEPKKIKEELIKEFEENICKLKKTTKPKFEKLIETKSKEFILKLIEYQASINTYSWAGFEKGIENFKDLETVEEIIDHINTFHKNQKERYQFTSKKKSTRNIKGSFHNFKQRDYDYDALEEELLNG